MQDVKQAYASAADLYWITFLLTGRSEFSLELVMEVISSETDPELLLSAGILANLRRIVREKALAAIQEELAISARKTAWLPLDHPCLPPSTWSLDANTSKLQIESALLALEVFPRCALLLTLFEGLNIGDASALLRSSRELTLKGQTLGLWNLTCHLARQGDWNPSFVLPLSASFESDSEHDGVSRRNPSRV